MRFALPFALLAVARAAPTPEAATEHPARSLLSSLSNKVLDFDDIVLYGVNGEYKVIKEAEFNNLTAEGTIPYGDLKEAQLLRSGNGSSNALQVRDCAGKNSEYTITSQAEFLDWDIQMSPVFGALQAPILVGISRGKTVGNSLRYSAGGDIGAAFVAAFSLKVGIDYEKSWSSADTSIITYTVPLGYYGAVINQPWTLRKYGNLYTSCTTSNWVKSGFMADSHTSQTYGNMDWVTGVFRMCASKTYPVPFCAGRGLHH